MNATSAKNIERERISADVFPPTWASEWGEDAYGLFADFAFQHHEEAKLAVVQRFRWIAAGDFMMGSPEDEPERWDGREDLHPVSLTQGYWLADTTVTQTLWQAIMKENPARFKDDKSPVENVSWDDAQEFLGIVNKKHEEVLSQQLLRLPTEAEWEHACRAGTTSPFSFGENITSEQVNYSSRHPYNNGLKEEPRGKTVPVKSLPSNFWGLYEMHGNVWEWCADAWQEQLGNSAVADPVQQGDKGSRRVVRGGAWGYDGWFVRSASRARRSPDRRVYYFGFRLSLGHELKSSKSER